MSATGLSDEEIRKRIVAIFSTLVADLDPDQMSDYLIEGLVITVIQWQDILHRQLTKQGRCRQLLNLLLNTKNPKAAGVFLNALGRNTQWHWILDLFSEKKLPKETEITESDDLRSEFDRRLEAAKLEWAEEKDELLEKLRHLEKQNDELQQRVKDLQDICEVDGNAIDAVAERVQNLDRVSTSRNSICSRKSLGRAYISGRIHLRLLYRSSLHQIQVTVVECKRLQPVDVKNRSSDPYVKLFMLPDEAKLTKRKTTVKYDTLDPVYMETFTFRSSFHDGVTQSLWISVWHRFRLWRNKCLGEVVIPLDEDLENEIDDWFYLEQQLP